MAYTAEELKKLGAVPSNKSYTLEELQSLGAKPDAPVAAPQAPNTYGATFRASPMDNPIQAGLKAAGNFPSSALNLAKGIGTAIANPIDTVKGAGQAIAGGAASATRQILEKTPLASRVNATPLTKDEEVFKGLAGFLKERYGSLENLQKTATEDPFGFGTDVLGLVTGGAALAGKGSEAASVISKVGKTAVKPVASTVEGAGNIAAGTTKFGISQATGLNPETITELVKNPQAFRNVNPEIRAQTATAVKDSLDARLNELSDLGKEYQAVREAPGSVSIPEGTIKSVLDKYGVKIDDNNQIVTSVESRPLSSGDRNALQEFITGYGQESNLSNNAFLNTREALSNLARYDASKTSLSTNISRELRSAYDDIGKAQVSGLKELDEAYAPERQLLGQLKKDIFLPNGELKETAISRIANIEGKGKEQFLNRVKELVPDIEQRVRVLKAVEDIERSSGLKVGTYTRAGIGLTGALTGNVPAIIGAILAQPEIAVPLLKGAGYVGNKARPILNAIMEIANDVNNFTLPPSIISAANNSEAVRG